MLLKNVYCVVGLTCNVQSMLVKYTIVIKNGHFLSMTIVILYQACSIYVHFTY